MHNHHLRKCHVAVSFIGLIGQIRVLWHCINYYKTSKYLVRTPLDAPGPWAQAYKLALTSTQEDSFSSECLLPWGDREKVGVHMPEKKFSLSLFKDSTTQQIFGSFQIITNPGPVFKHTRLFISITFRHSSFATIGELEEGQDREMLLSFDSVFPLSINQY